LRKKPPLSHQDSITRRYSVQQQQQVQAIIFKLWTICKLRRQIHALLMSSLQLIEWKNLRFSHRDALRDKTIYTWDMSFRHEQFRLLIKPSKYSCYERRFEIKNSGCKTE
jgi:hypothetical protein